MHVRDALTAVLLLALATATAASLNEVAHAQTKPPAPVPVRKSPAPATPAKAAPAQPAASTAGSISLSCGLHGGWTGIFNNGGSWYGTPGNTANAGFPVALCQGPGNTYYAAALQGLNAAGMTAQQLGALNSSVTTVKCTPSAASAVSLATGNGEFGAAQHASKSADITFTIKPPLSGATCVVSNPAFATAASPVMTDTTLLIWGGNNASTCTVEQMAQRFDLTCHF
jgi:hypothetical protein